MCGLIQYTGIDFLIWLFVCLFFKCEKEQQEGSGQEQPTQT